MKKLINKKRVEQGVPVKKPKLDEEVKDVKKDKVNK